MKSAICSFFALPLRVLVVVLGAVLTASQAQAQLVQSTASLKFPKTAYGNRSNPLPVTFTNSGVYAINVLSYGLSVSSDDPYNTFTVTSNCGATLSPGQSCVANFAFSPSSSATNNRMSLFTVVTDEPKNATHTISLTGTSTAQGLQPLSIQYTQSIFPPTVVGSAAPLITTKVTNPNTVPVTVFNISLTGANASDFYFPSTTCGPVIPASGTCSFTTGFTPGGTGSRTASLYYVASSDATSYITLQGTGSLPPGVVFTPPSRTFALPFRLGLSDSSLPGSLFSYGTSGGFHYTTDGSNPADSPTAQTYFSGGVQGNIGFTTAMANGIEVSMPETINAVSFYQGSPAGYGDTGSATYTLAPGTPAGSISTYYTGTNKPFGLAFDFADNLYILDSTGVVLRTASGVTGSFYFHPGTTAITTAASGDLIVADGAGQVLVVPVAHGLAPFVIAGGGTGAIADGVPATSVKLDTINGIAFDASGNLYLTDVMATNPGYSTGVSNSSMGRVLRVDTSGTLSVIAGGGPILNGLVPAVESNGPAKGQSLWSANSIVIGPDGSIYFTDDRNYQFQYGVQADSGYLDKIDPGGNLTVLQVPTNSVPSGLAFDKAGNLYFGDSLDSEYQDLGYIRQVRPDGTVSFLPGATLGTVPFIDRAAEQFVGTQGAIAFDSKGSAYYTNGSAVQKFSFQ